MYYTIHQVSEKMNLPAHTLRYYEKEGLLSCVQRSEGGIRRFSEEDMEWLGLIRCLKSTGMPIRQIKSFVDLCHEGDGTLQQRCEMLERHKKDVEERILTMQSQLEKVTAKIRHIRSHCQACGNAASGGC